MYVAGHKNCRSFGCRSVEIQCSKKFFGWNKFARKLVIWPGYVLRIIRVINFPDQAKHIQYVPAQVNIQTLYQNIILCEEICITKKLILYWKIVGLMSRTCVGDHTSTWFPGSCKTYVTVSGSSEQKISCHDMMIYNILPPKMLKIWWTSYSMKKSIK